MTTSASPTTTCVAFVDFDGVLNDRALRDRTAPNGTGLVRWTVELGRARLDPVRVARLQRICDASGCAVVIVSGWRQWLDLGTMAELLASVGLRAPVLGAVSRSFAGDARADGTSVWLGAHPEVERYVVIDDTAKLWWDWEDVLVAPTDGLTDADADRAIYLLSRGVGL